MSKPRRNTSVPPRDDALFAVKRKVVPHEFVLDAIAPLAPRTRPMFGCLAVYVEDKIVLILRDKRDKTADNGVWLATTEEHHKGLRRKFPNMRSIQVLGNEVTGWQVLPADAPDFEEAALRACELIGAILLVTTSSDHSRRWWEPLPASRFCPPSWFPIPMPVAPPVSCRFEGPIQRG
jgi:hypothetical protein